VNGVKQHCVGDQGNGMLCAPECNNNTNCPTQAKCLALPDGSANICYPRAGVCVGDGSLCAPCLSDADCPNGACVHAATELAGDYSTETFCAVKASSQCVSSTGSVCGGTSGCPKSEFGGLKNPVCCQAANDPYVPRDMCIGLVQFGVSAGSPGYAPGCFTPKR
jgi:hypothetical protein